jgi:hypothetical protein
MQPRSLLESIVGVGRHTRAPQVLYRALVVFTGIKVTMGWSAWETALRYTVLPDSVGAKLLYAPVVLGQHYPGILLLVTLLFLVACCWLGLRYGTALAFSWLCLNVYKIAIPIDNGSDPLALMLSLGLTLVAFFQPKHGPVSLSNSILASLAVRLCQLHIVFIYFVSGWDKLMSPAWRSGDAVAAISFLDTVINPALYDTLEYGAIEATILAWMGILFELAFGALVWSRTTRPWILAAGVVFHLIIAWALSLPDLSLLLILSYTIFLTDEDYTRLRRWPTKSPEGAASSRL